MKQMLEPAPALRRDVERWLQQLGARPEWLLAAVSPERVVEELRRVVPEFAAGTLRLKGCKTARLFLKDARGVWRGTYRLVVADAAGQTEQLVPLRVEVHAPALPAPDHVAAPALPFASADWTCYLPDLHMLCEHAPPEQALAVLPELTDPVASRAMIERSLRAGSSSAREIRIAECAPTVVNYKPGSRCTLRYDLQYAPADQERGWPTMIIAKTYDDATGEQAYQGMAALWHSPLSRSQAVKIAEPLAYVSEHRLLLQGALAEERTLLAAFNAAMRSGDAAAWRELRQVVATAATGLAELHLSGANASAVVTWDEQVANLYELLDRLQHVAPAAVAAARPLVEQFEALARQHPADRLVPSHGSFDSEQVLLGGSSVSFIDFDSFCRAEPALDVAHFRAALMDSGMKLIDPETLADPGRCQAYLGRLDALCAHFLAAYTALAPISLERLALWEAADYLRDVLHLWKKPQARGAEATLQLLAFHLAKMGVAP